jgi:hypothetical protein
VCKRFYVEVGGIHDGRLREFRRRVLLSDAAVEDDDFVVTIELSRVA